MVNSPIKWMGGKKQLRKTIIEMFPSHTCYVEVFGGAGWVLFGKEPSISEVYNDLNSELYNFFDVIKNSPDEFLKTFEYILYSREYFNKIIDRRNEPRDRITRAHDFFYRIHSHFGGNYNRLYNWGYELTRKPIDFSEIEPIIKATYKRLSRVFIENKPFDDIIPRYDSGKTLFFCDPPYYELSDYNVEFTKEDHEKLCELLKNIKGKFLLTINDHKEVREWYNGYFIKEVEIIYRVARNQEAKSKTSYELIITNYDPLRLQPSLLDYMEVR